MMLDMWIGLAAFISTSFLAYESIAVALRPPKKSDARSRRRITYFASFAAVLLVLASVVQNYRNAAVTQELLIEERKNEDTLVESKVFPVTTGKVGVGRPLWFKIGLVPHHNPAADLNITGLMYVGSSSEDEDSDTAWRLLRENENSDKTSPHDTAENMSIWETVGTGSLSSAEADRILGGPDRVYVVYSARWRNVSGSESHLRSCNWTHILPTTDTISILWSNCATLPQ